MTEIDDRKWFGPERGGEPIGLSEAGRARKNAMQLELLAAVVSRRRRRTAVRWSAVALAAAVLAAVSWPTAELAPTPAPREQSAALHNFDYAVVRDDAVVLERCVARSSSIAAETWVDDSQLVALLAAADRPTGLIRTPTRVVLTAQVIDPIGE